MKKRIWVLGVLFLLGSSALAQSYDMTVHLSSGESVVIPLDDILRVEFTGVMAGAEEPGGLAAAARAFLLRQNYPNPARSTTTIEYQIPAEAEVRVRVFDMEGALVKELLHEIQGAGRHRVTWDATVDNRVPVASGMYLYAVECGGETLTKRLIVVR